MPLLPFALASPGQQHDDVIPAALLALALILVGAKLAGEIFERFGQPAVLGELCAGILLGNLALVGGPTFESISQGETFLFLSELGAILLLFHVGLESTPREMMAVGGRATLVALAGVVAPMALGYGVGRVLRPDDSWMVHVFLGAMLCATSVGITARVLKGVSGLAVGLGMMPRGEVGLIFAGIGARLILDGHPIIDSSTYAAAVFMVVATTLATPPLLLWAMRRHGAGAPSPEEAV